MTPLPAPVLGGGVGGGPGRPLPLQGAPVCEVATCPASCLPVGSLFGLSACLAACGVRSRPPPPHPAWLCAPLHIPMELGGNRRGHMEGTVGRSPIPGKDNSHGGFWKLLSEATGGPFRGPACGQTDPCPLPSSPQGSHPPFGANSSPPGGVRVGVAGGEGGRGSGESGRAVPSRPPTLCL